MQNEKKITESPVQTQNEQARLIEINKAFKSANEQEILKVVKNYLDCNDCSEPIDCIGFLHQEFLDKHENIEEYDPKYLSSLNFQVKELYLLLSRLQVCSGIISNSTRIIKILTPNPASL